MEDTKIIGITKRCAKCLTYKPFSDFNKNSRASGGIHNHCRQCQRVVRHEWYLKNKTSEKEKSKVYSKTEKARLARAKRWLAVKHIIGPKNNDRRKTPAARAKAKIQRERWLEIPQNRIAQSLRGRIRKALKNIAQSAETEKLVGCSFVQLKLYLEEQFKPGMSWDNYGKWHIDHKKPCAAFDLTDANQQAECFHYTNLQPLWRTENQSKGARLYVVK